MTIAAFPFPEIPYLLNATPIDSAMVYAQTCSSVMQHLPAGRPLFPNRLSLEQPMLAGVGDVSARRERRPARRSASHRFEGVP